jgi:hypothetical protein
MNCDHVFDILTRGPFPAGESTDDAVERHLGRCHECRQLAEALRPAVEMFHEAVDIEEHEQLPGYRGKWAAVDAPWEGATATATRTASLRPAALLRRTWCTSPPARAMALRLAAAGVLLGVVCVLLFGLSGGEPESSKSLAVASAGHGTPGDGDAASLQLLTSLKLPQNCLHPVAANVEHSHGRLQCCTRCHAEGLAHRPQLTRSRLADLARSCQACHES